MNSDLKQKRTQDILKDIKSFFQRTYTLHEPTELTKLTEEEIKIYTKDYKPAEGIKIVSGDVTIKLDYYELALAETIAKCTPKQIAIHLLQISMDEYDNIYKGLLNKFNTDNPFDLIDELIKWKFLNKKSIIKNFREQSEFKKEIDFKAPKCPYDEIELKILKFFFDNKNTNINQISKELNFSKEYIDFRLKNLVQKKTPFNANISDTLYSVFYFGWIYMIKECSTNE